ncbi:PAS domain S-box protein [candidate division KSB1 bacterium]|nr:PAS domain S-box protein [candidate division KSB1 bacterium]
MVAAGTSGAVDLRIVFEPSPTPTCLIDDAGVVCWGNAACRSLFGSRLSASGSQIHRSIDTEHILGMLKIGEPAEDIRVLMPDQHRVFSLSTYRPSTGDMIVAFFFEIGWGFSKDLGDPGLFYIGEDILHPQDIEGEIERVTGYTRQDFVSGRVNWLDVVAPQDQDFYTAALQEDSKTRMHHLLYRLIDRHGQSHLIWQENYRRFYPADSSFFYSALWDISAHLFIFGCGENKGKRRRRLQELSSDAVLAGAIGGQLDYANHRAAELFGYDTPQDLLHSIDTIFDLVLPEERERAHRETTETLVKGRMLLREYPMVKKNGEVFTAEIRAFSRLDRHGHIEAVLGSVCDVSLRRQERARFIEQALFLRRDVKSQAAELRKSHRRLEIETRHREETEQSLRESEAFHRLVIESAQEVIVVIDETGCFRLVNPAAAKLLGQKVDVCIGRSLRDFLPADLAARYIENLQRLVLEKRSERLQSSVPLPGGEACFSIHIQPLADSGSGEKRIMLIATDITAQRRQEVELENYHQRLEHLVQDRTHELVEMNRRLKQEIAGRMQIERELRKSQESYQLLVENQGDLVVRVDQNNCFTFVSPSFCDLYGRSEEELLGQPFLPLVHEDDREFTLRQMGKVGRPPYHVRYEQRAATRHGWRWIQWDVKGLLDTDRKLVATVGTGRDVTEQRESEEQLRRSEERIREIIERSPDCYFFFDENGYLRTINQSMCRLAGASEEHLVGRHYSEFALPASTEIMDKLSGRVKSGQSIGWQEMEMKRLDGSNVWVGFSARRVMERGIVVGIEGFLRDLTAIRAASRQIEQERARYRALFSNIPDEVFSLDAKGRFSDANPTFHAHWGDVTGKTPQQAFAQPELVEVLEQNFRVSVEGGRVVSQTFSVERDGRRIIYSLSMKAIRTMEDLLIGVVGLNADITDLESAIERSRRLSNRLLQVQEEERTRISRELHDTIIQHLSALQMKLSTADAVLASRPDYARQLLNRSLEFLAELIAMVRQESYLLRPPLLDDFGIKAAVQDYMREFSAQWGVSVYCRCDLLEDHLDRTLATAVFRIAQEALANVRKHSRSRRARIRLWKTPTRLCLLVRDYGVGFDTHKTDAAGRGDHLGLLGMRERTEILGGDFSLQSWSGRGTRVYVSIPFDPLGSQTAFEP